MSLRMALFGWFQYGLGSAWVSWRVHENPHDWTFWVGFGIVLAGTAFVGQFFAPADRKGTDE